MPVSDGHPRGTPWDAALRYLGQRDHSRLEVQQKLERRGFPAEEINATLERLTGAGLLDDGAYAQQKAASLFANRGSSVAEVRRKLAQKGVSAADIDRAITPANADADFERACAEVERRGPKMLGLPAQTRQRRLLSHLARRGFPEGVCYRAVLQWEAAQQD